MIDDVFIGNNNFNAYTFMMINNEVLGTVFPKGTLQVKGILRIPFHYRKKETVTITGKVNLTGDYRAHRTLSDVILNNSFFSKTIVDPNANVTITIRPRQGDPTRFDVTNLRYEFTNDQ